MPLWCIGLSHKTAPVELREKLSLDPSRQEEILKSVSVSGAEALLVSTCNRVEFYLAGDAAERCRAEVVDWISRLGGEGAQTHLYEQRGEAAMVHLFRVAASLDSMVVGEPQILGQVKDALELAQKAGVARGELTRAFSAAFGSAKRVRSETAIGRAATSMAAAAVELAKKIFFPFSDQTVLIVGAGEMAELAAKHLRAAGADRIWVTNRTFQRAEELAAQVGGLAQPFESLWQTLISADVVVSSTASPTPIFTREKVAGILKARRYRRLLMVDLAVPRDVATDVNTLENVYTVDVDDIQEMVAENSAARAAEAGRAETIVAEEVARFIRERSVRVGTPVLGQLRARAEQIKRTELEKTFAQLRPNLSEDELKKTIEALANALVNKLLHQPTAKLRAIAPQEGHNPLAGAVAELFGLGEAREPEPPAREESPVSSFEAGSDPGGSEPGPGSPRSALAAGGRKR